MFGYVRPDAPELRIKDYARYRACYCGLCHELGDRYGIVARFVLNYDLVFLAMLLWRGEASPEYGLRRCPPSPCKKRCVACASRPVTVSAGYSVILSWWRLCDAVEDNGRVKGLPYRLARRFLRRAYRNAAGEYPDFDADVRRYLSELTELERAGEPSMDRAADKFALLLASAAGCETDEPLRRILEQLLYHVGRVIYLADAFDDLEEDFRDRRYNPVAARFAITGGTAEEEVRTALRQTMDDSLRRVEAAYELLPRNYWSEITDNSIYMGLPAMCRQVLAGGWNRKQKLPRTPQTMAVDWRKTYE